MNDDFLPAGALGEVVIFEVEPRRSGVEMVFGGDAGDLESAGTVRDLDFSRDEFGGEGLGGGAEIEIFEPITGLFGGLRFEGWLGRLRVELPVLEELIRRDFREIED